MKGFDALKGFLDGQPKRTPGGERRLGRRVPMRMPVRITTLDGLTWDGRVCDVNKRGLAIEPNQGIAKNEHLTAAFPAYEGVWPKFELKVVVRRLVADPQTKCSVALGVEIDRERTSAEASQAFGKMVLHFLRDRALLKEQNEGRHVARCMSCDWIAMEETAEPRCPICQSRLIPHESLPTHQQ
jgi:hypothetical protein